MAKCFAELALLPQNGADRTDDAGVAGGQRKCLIQQLARAFELALAFKFPGDQVQEHRITNALVQGLIRKVGSMRYVAVDQRPLDRLPYRLVKRTHRSSTSLP